MIKNFQTKFDKHIIYLLLILLVGFYFRTFNINWDSGFSFHPDERAIVMFTIPLTFPQSFAEFLSPESPLNPNFFAYGNFPLYLLKIAGEVVGFFNPILKDYGGLQLVGRAISAIFDTATIILIYILGKKTFSRTTGIFAAFLYGVSTLPIQLSHYYAVDTILTFFIILTLLIEIYFLKKQTYLYALLLGISFGLALATKVSAVIFIVSILLIFGLIIYKKRGKEILRTAFQFVLFISVTFFTFIATQPYVLLDFSNFFEQVQLQSKMSRDAFIFPYTLQYFNKTPYLYEMKNIFFWGLGPFISLLSIAGLLIYIRSLFVKKISIESVIIFSSLLLYFSVFGSFAVGWMRYMLPIYPLFVIFSGYSVAMFIKKQYIKAIIKDILKRKLLLVGFVILILLHPFSFIEIYKKVNTRIQASYWMDENIKIGSVLAIEHWDDSLPVINNNKYVHLTLPLYDPDTNMKWEGIEQTLNNADYIIIASNRLYEPLQKMTDCMNLPPGRCYKRTSKYYSDLFDSKLNFIKVAEFTEYPKIPFTNFKFIDDTADESFTVYDHPKVMIFKKIKSD